MTQDSSTDAKRALRNAILQGDITLGQAVKQMRDITGLNQRDYAQRIVGISPRILAEVERDEGNPTVATLNKIGRPFGFEVGFVKRK